MKGKNNSEEKAKMSSELLSTFIDWWMGRLGWVIGLSWPYWVR